MLICRPSQDIRLIPPNLACERDTLEIRVQFRCEAPEDKFSVKAEFFLDQIAPKLKISEQLAPASIAWQLLKCHLPLTGRAGEHQIIARLITPVETVECVQNFTVLPEPEMKLRGGFIMLGPPNDAPEFDNFRSQVKALTDAEWEQQLMSWNAIGIKTLIIIATYQPLTCRGGEIHAHYPSRIFPQTPDLAATDPVAAVLRAAERLQQQVFIGLGHFKESPRRSEVIAEIFERYGHFKSFYGWYGSYEFGTAWASWSGVGAYWQDIRREVDKLAPVMPILISPYQFNLSLDIPPELEFTPETKFAEQLLIGPHPAFREYLLQHPGSFDILMPQDGVGKRYPLALPADLITRCQRTFAAFREITDAAGIHLWANVESFDFTPDGVLHPRYAGGGFDGPDGLVQQLEAVGPHCEQLLTFCLSGFWADPDINPPIGGVQAVEQFTNYQQYLTHLKSGIRNIARGKKYTCRPEPAQIMGDDAECGKLTDGKISGGMALPVDDERLIGFMSTQADENGDLTVEIIVDLERPENFDVVRLGGAVRRIKGRAAELAIAISDDRATWRHIGQTQTYDHGFLQWQSAQTQRARYVKLSVRKHFTTSINRTFGDSWLLLDEVEIGQRITR